MNRIYEMRKTIFNYSLILFFICYTCLLLLLARNTVVWEDELYTLHTTAGSVPFAFTESYNFEGQPPVYFVLLSIWRNLSDSLFFARSFSVLFVLLSGLLIYKLCRILLDHYFSALIMVLFLITPFIVSQSFDARLYSFIIFLSLSSLYTFYKAYLLDSKSSVYKLFHCFISLTGVFTEYFFIFPLIAQAIALIPLRGLKKFINYSLIQFPVAILFGINYLIVSRGLNIYSGNSLLPAEMFRRLLMSVQNFLFSFNSISLGFFVRRLILLLYFIWLISIFRNLKFSFRSLYERTNSFLFQIIISLLIFLLFTLFFLTQKTPYVDKYMSVLYPSLFLVFAISLTMGRKLSFLILVSLLLLYNGFIDFSTYSRYVRVYDYEQIAEYVEKVKKPDEPMLLYSNGHALPFQYYYKGNNPILPLPVPIRFNLNYMNEIYIKDTLMLNKIFEKDRKIENHFIYISDNLSSLMGKSLNYDIVDQYFERKFYVRLDTLIKGRSKNAGLRVREYERKTHLKF
jgi:hypothetical protein